MGFASVIWSASWRMCAYRMRRSSSRNSRRRQNRQSRLLHRPAITPRANQERRKSILRREMTMLAMLRIILRATAVRHKRLLKRCALAERVQMEGAPHLRTDLDSVSVKMAEAAAVDLVDIAPMDMMRAFGPCAHLTQKYINLRFDSITIRLPA